MKILTLLFSAVVLTGCATSVPVVPAWPEAPKELLKSCPNLKTVDSTNDKLSVIVDTVADNYQEYYKCKDQVDDWITWYTSQQKLWKTLK